ncbi:MAG: type II toxin-antitoxin system VapB family antitoxin [Spirochaetaceae bacterium]|jgi:Arc/MetJ family transcription regulator|nr:type II toxin-antitoxin system VapB family antitoxin [Spirochaetaceae bacterium]
MTATIELNDGLVTKAKKLSGIADDKDLVQMALKRYIEGTEFLRAAIRVKKEIGDENPFWEGYDPKA